jgi:uncharacterized protein
MAVSLYDVTIPAFLRAFASLDHVLAKAEAHAKEKGVDANAILKARLIDDMYTLIEQVQRASDTAKMTAVRLAGVENEKMADTEQTFADLHARIAKTVAFLKTVPREAFDKHANATIEMKMGSGTVQFSPLDYVVQFGLPNFYFHATTAYDIIRFSGVSIGKKDFLNIGTK